MREEDEKLKKDAQDFAVDILMKEWATVVFTHRIGGSDFKLRVFRTNDSIIKI